MRVLLPHPRIDGMAWWLIAAAVALLIVLLVGLSAVSAADKDSANVNRLIRQLDNEDFAKREAAGKELELMINAALPALCIAAEDETYPEICHRVRAILCDFYRDRIRPLINDLGAEEYEKREAAANRIRKIGKPALPFLRVAVGSDDPEVGSRAHAILMYIVGAK